MRELVPVKADQLDAVICIVERGRADPVVKSAMKAGAQGATIFYARGTGVRQKLGLLGTLIQPEKEVIIIVTPSRLTDDIFEAIVKAGKLDTPGKGFAFVQKVEKAIGLLE